MNIFQTIAEPSAQGSDVVIPDGKTAINAGMLAEYWAVAQTIASSLGTSHSLLGSQDHAAASALIRKMAIATLAEPIPEPTPEVTPHVYLVMFGFHGGRRCVANMVHTMCDNHPDLRDHLARMVYPECLTQVLDLAAELGLQLPKTMLSAPDEEGLTYIFADVEKGLFELKEADGQLLLTMSHAASRMTRQH